MRVVKITILFFFLFSMQLVSAQVELLEDDYVLLSPQQRFDSLLVLHKKLNAIDESTPGYRVQIYFESGNFSKSKAMELKELFELDHPGIKAYVSFNEPYYRVRVGDFRTKIEAIGFLKKIIKTYPNAFEVSDMISFANSNRVRKI